jgi:retron-type reverse transcriptase
LKTLQGLKEAKNLADLAKLLGFTPSGLSYILYKLDPKKKYRTFEIKKKTGGTRTINAPDERLSLLQTRLSEQLYKCVAELKHENPRFWQASHGFQKSRTILSNAAMHRRRYFVFNIDLENFFGTINFGRVRGFFINDRQFKLEPSVATVIAQIACHENALPQGSPCSPVISNLIGNILDSRLLALARDARCTYTRYADDLTFSTNEILFPTEIAVNVHGSKWIVGSKLRSEIEDAGFKLNEVKTRMSLRQSRQTVTGLVVNVKPNVAQDYYRSVRAMCNAVFQSGAYHRGDPNKAVPISNLNSLDGMLAHINFVKARRDRRHKINKLAMEAGEFNPPQAPIELYRKLLFFKYFVAPQAPLVVTEGISDIVYLHCAIRSLGKTYPELTVEKDGKLIRRIHFLKPSGITRDILNLGHGTAGQASLIGQYTNKMKRYKHKPMERPIIILCDNDGGAKTVLKAASTKSGVTISDSTTEPFYYLGENLYLVKVPEGTPPEAREIEQLFEPVVLTRKINGKPFDRKKEHGDETAYGKVVFAEKVIRPNAKSINFAGFAELLSRFELCIKHYRIKQAATSALVPVAAAASAS